MNQMALGPHLAFGLCPVCSVNWVGWNVRVTAASEGKMREFNDMADLSVFS